MSKIDFDHPTRADARAWCSDCPKKWWGIWAHKGSHDHHELEMHRVHLIIPSTDEEKAEAKAEIARLDAQEDAELARRGVTKEEAEAEAVQSVRDQIARYTEGLLS